MSNLGDQKYFVIGSDGSKYGPASIQELNQWAAEGRVLASTQLEEAETGRRMMASFVPGFVPGAAPSGPSQPDYSQPPGATAHAA